MGEVFSARVPGRPAAFAGGEPERRWKEALRVALPPAQRGFGELGLRVVFTLSPPAPGRPGADIDNLLDPILSVLINNLGWFGGSRSAIAFILATKERGDQTGCEIEILTASPTPAPTGTPALDAFYEKALPTSARDELVAGWARERAISGEQPSSGTFGVALHFADARVNLGDVATGKPKPVIDCLWPILGGSARAPHDHLITDLRLSRSPSPAGSGVHIAVWRS